MQKDALNSVDLNKISNNSGWIQRISIELKLTLSQKSDKIIDKSLHNFQVNYS